MQAISEYFFSVLLCILLTTQCGIAQEQNNAEQETRQSTKGGFAPSAVRIGVSLSDIATTLTNPQTLYYGFQADLPIRQFMISIDYGQAQLNLENRQTEQTSRNFTYSSQGSFFRAGIDANLLKDRATGSNDAQGDVIFFGLKYAHSRQDDHITFRPSTDSITNIIYNISEVDQSNNNLGAWWLEMNAGVKVEIFKNIFLGYALRYKFFRRFGGRNSLIPYRVPGFGKGNQENAFSLDYYIYYRIPFSK